MNSAREADRQVEAGLVARAAGGDETAFAALYDRFAPGLYSLLIKMLRDEREAEDALQEGFAHLWRRASTYDPERSSAFTWAVMIMRNKAIDRMRARQRQQRNLDRAAAKFATGAETGESSARTAERKDDSARVRTALEQVSAEQKLALELAFFGGLTHEEIAEKLETPLGTIKARIRRGLLKLRDFLKEAA